MYRSMKITALAGVIVAAAVAVAADDSNGKRGDAATAAIPFVSLYSNAPEPGALRTTDSRIHRLLARGIAKVPQAQSLKVWVFFRDKGVATDRDYDAAIADVSSKYDRRALSRRAKRRSRPGLFDERDLDVPAAYVQAVEATGAIVRVKSKWLNALSVHATGAQLERIDRLPFVKLMQPVRRSRRIEPLKPQGADAGISPGSGVGRAAPGFYGEAEDQLTQINLLGVHNLGFTGKNVIIGVLDTGFERIHEAFTDPAHPVKVLAEWDFVNNDPDVGFEPGDDGFQHAHGTWILGTIAAYLPNDLVGGAYDASFILCKTEDVTAEYHGEEDNYVAGLEFIEANGGDLATASLSYLDFDFPFSDYTQEDLDGLTAVTTIGVNVATANGIHCLNAAGNSGHDEDPATSTLGAPADAFEVLTVGAVNSAGDTASFSSSGPTADGRVKPEILARGVNTRTVDAFAETGFSGVGGTSLSTPLAAAAVACLTDAFPNWTPAKMREALFETADYFVANGTFEPNYVRGYGILNALDALRADCNDNDVDDLTDIANGSLDCNGNDIPDECERDCNDNGVPDQCDAGTTSPDCNANGVPDECEMDCDGDGTPDDCETDPADRDCDFDGVCNEDAIANCPPFDTLCADCNANQVPDFCDTWLRTSPDSDGNGVPDECVPAAQIAAAPHDARKNRYISIDPSDNDEMPVAINVTLSSMTRCSGDLALTCVDNADCPMATGPCVEHPGVGTALGWVGQPWDASCADENGVPNGEPCTGEFLARVVGAPVFRTWLENPLHIGDCEIVPVATYELRVTLDEVFFSDPIAVGTIRKPAALHLGDTVGEGTGDLPPLPGFTPPQGVVNVSDVQAIQLTVQGPSSPSAHKTWVDLEGLGTGSPPNFIVNVSDIQQVILGLQGKTYTDNPAQLNPPDCP